MAAQTFGPQRVPPRVRLPLQSGAFTLLELILSLAIIAVVMTGVMSATTLFAQYYSRSIEGNRQAKVLAGTVEDLRDDLRACFAADIVDALAAAESASRASKSKSGLLPEFAVNERVLAYEDEMQEQPIHFVGRPNSLLLLRTGWSSRFTSSDRAKSQDCQIVWIAPGVDSIRLPTALVGERVIKKTFQPKEKSLGLKRLATSAASYKKDLARFPARQSHVAGKWDTNVEVSFVAFRYFSGENWRESWDSHLELGRLPLAVEVEIANHAATSSDASLRSRALAAQRFRFVIRLPSASSSLSDGKVRE